MKKRKYIKGTLMKKRYNPNKIFYAVVDSTPYQLNILKVLSRKDEAKKYKNSVIQRRIEVGTNDTPVIIKTYTAKDLVDMGLLRDDVVKW